MKKLVWETLAQTLLHQRLWHSKLIDTKVNVILIYFYLLLYICLWIDLLDLDLRVSLFLLRCWIDIAKEPINQLLGHGLDVCHIIHDVSLVIDIGVRCHCISTIIADVNATRFIAGLFNLIDIFKI